jgi:hypothetical protein
MADFLDDVKSPGSPAAGDRRADAAAEIARLAGKIALDYFERAEISWKLDDSMVTDADVAVESWLEDEIARAFPADGGRGGRRDDRDGGRRLHDGARRRRALPRRSSRLRRRADRVPGGRPHRSSREPRRHRGHALMKRAAICVIDVLFFDSPPAAELAV